MKTQRPWRDTGRHNIFGRSRSEGRCTSFTSNIYQNSANLLAEKSRLVDKPGVALLAVLNSEKEWLCHQISIKREDGEVWIEQQMLWHVKASRVSLVESKFYWGHSEDCLFAALGCERGRYIPPYFSCFRSRTQWVSWITWALQDGAILHHSQQFCRVAFASQCFPTAAIPHLPAQNMTPPESHEVPAAILELGMV